MSEGVLYEVADDASIQEMVAISDAMYSQEYFVFLHNLRTFLKRVSYRDRLKDVLDMIKAFEEDRLDELPENLWCGLREVSENHPFREWSRAIAAGKVSKYCWRRFWRETWSSGFMKPIEDWLKNRRQSHG